MSSEVAKSSKSKGMGMARIKTCIVCGGAAGSKEHVFPASLGGRRKNSGIYCTTHDNSYSGLVSELAAQVDFLNAHLGVRSDHTKQKKVIYELDSKSGAEIAISDDVIKFTKPRVISERPTENGVAVSLDFPDKASLNQWLKKQKAAGVSVEIQGKPTQTRYFPGSVLHKRAFGGDCGLGSLAYLMQTFAAQAFPDIARSGAMVNFITFTQAIAKVAILGGCVRTDEENEALKTARLTLDSALQSFGGGLPVWWDFDVFPTLPPNAFEFGHRVTVGVDRDDGQIYGRISLFSALNFAACLGHARDVPSSHEVIIDIDPLADNPPNDIAETVMASAPSRVHIPTVRTEALARAISDGTQQKRFEGLQKRMEEHQLAGLAKRMTAALVPSAGMATHDRHSLLEQVIDRESQQVWRLMRKVMTDLAAHFRSNGLDPVAKVVALMIAEDGDSGSGLSQWAEVCLALAKAALVAQMEEDCVQGALDEKRIADLMGRGTGMHLVGEMLIAPLMNYGTRSAP